MNCGSLLLGTTDLNTKSLLTFTRRRATRMAQDMVMSPAVILVVWVA